MYQGYLSAVLTVTCILTEMALYIFEAENCQLFVI